MRAHVHVRHVRTCTPRASYFSCLLKIKVHQHYSEHDDTYVTAVISKSRASGAFRYIYVLLREVLLLQYLKAAERVDFGEADSRQNPNHSNFPLQQNMNGSDTCSFRDPCDALLKYIQ